MYAIYSLIIYCSSPFSHSYSPTCAALNILISPKKYEQHCFDQRKWKNWKQISLKNESTRQRPNDTINVTSFFNSLKLLTTFFKNARLRHVPKLVLITARLVLCHLISTSIHCSTYRVAYWAKCFVLLQRQIPLVLWFTLHDVRVVLQISCLVLRSDEWMICDGCSLVVPPFLYYHFFLEL